MSARLSRRTLTMNLTVQQRAFALLDALMTARADQGAVWDVWAIASKLGDPECPDDGPLATSIWSARCRGVVIDARQIAQACACACQRDLRLLHPGVATAIERPLPPPSAVAATVPAPAAWPGRKGGAA